MMHAIQVQINGNTSPICDGWLGLGRQLTVDEPLTQRLGDELQRRIRRGPLLERPGVNPFSN